MPIPETDHLCYDAHMTTDKTSPKRRSSKQGNGGKKRALGSPETDSARNKARPMKPGKRSAHIAGAKGRSKAKPTRDDRALTAADRFDVAEADRGERIAKVMARVGLCSRRDAEKWIADGRVQVNGKVLETPAVTVTARDQVLVDGELLPMRERTRLWLYHKPRGLVTTNRDPEGRPTVFEKLPEDLPRVMAVGRLDINTEGLLLLTNDGGLARVLELPSTGWLRRYRVRAFGKVTQADLDALGEGIAIDGVLYGAIEASLDKEQGDNVWLTVGLREGKNREVKRVLEHLGLAVNRLIRISFGPFQLQDLSEGEVREIRGRVLRDQLGETLAEEAGADFDAPLLHPSKRDQDKAGGAKGKERSKDGARAAKGHWLTARDGEQAASGRGGGKGRKSGAEGGEKPKRRKNAGERQAKVSPRSHFRMTSEPKARREDDRMERPSRPPRRIWGEEGQLEDKQQESRMSRPKRPPRRDDRGGGRS